MASKASIGLIAGSGNLPLDFARRARRKGFSLVTVAIKGAASAQLNSLSDSIHWIYPGQLGSLLSFFRNRKVRRAVMHGKVAHAFSLKNLRLDWKALSIYLGLKDRSGDGLLRTLAGELGKGGVRLMDARFLMKDLLAPRGLLTRSRLSREDLLAARHGLKNARALAKLGIGQTMIVKKYAVVAVEAMEGTDQAILRAGRTAGAGIILAKASSPRQDWRFDVPTIGLKTLRSLVHAKARGMVLEAGRCFLLDREKLVAEADRKGIFILAV